MPEENSIFMKTSSRALGILTQLHSETAQAGIDLSHLLLEQIKCEIPNKILLCEIGDPVPGFYENCNSSRNK